MSGILEGKVALVTGGSTGIGRATSIILAREGATVAIADVQDEEGANTVGLAEEAGGKAEYHHVDVGDYDQVKALTTGIADRHGSLDGAFNNAGIEGPTAKIENYSMEDWDRVIRVNLTGVFICLKCEIEQMITQDTGGSIISTSSAAGLVGLTKTVALEYGSRNIRVNAVCPGFIETPMLDRVTDASVKIRDQLIKMVPARRVAKASEIGDAVAWLMSEQSSYVTGVALPVDGGWVAQ